MRCAVARQMQFAPGAILVFDPRLYGLPMVYELNPASGLFCDAVEGNADTECWRSVKFTAARGAAG